MVGTSAPGVIRRVGPQVPGLTLFVVAALLAPLLWSSGGGFPPRIFSGDEPHYLLMINSLLLDGDLDLANNYASVSAGSQQAGRNFAGAALDHQTVWFENGQRRNWESVYERAPERFDHDAQGRPVPRLLAGQAPPPPGQPEYSQHPPGMALLLAPLLYPLRHTPFVESAAVLCSAMSVIAAFFLFRWWLAKYQSDTRAADLMAIVAFLGTPAWPYARTLFTEPYLLAFAVAAYALGLRGHPLLSGIPIALGMLMKPPFALLAIPLFLMRLRDRNFAAVVRFSVPVALAAAAVLLLDTMMFGTPWRGPQTWLGGSLLRGTAGILISPRYGLLLIAPALLVALAAWPNFLRRFPEDGAVIAGGIILYFLLAASWRFWNGATAYGARIVMPVVPLVCVSLVALPTSWLWPKVGLRRAAIAICALSILSNGFAAIRYWESWDTNTPLRLAALIAGWSR